MKIVIEFRDLEELEEIINDFRFYLEYPDDSCFDAVSDILQKLEKSLL